MTSKDDNNILDKQLAEFTDQLLAGNTPQDVAIPELEALTKTVQHLHSAFGASDEIDNASKRVQNRVMAQWATVQQEKTGAKSKRSSWWKQINRQQMSLAVSLAVILLLVVATPWLLTSIPSTPGAAGAIKPGTAIGVGLIFLVITVLISRLRNKK